MFCNPRAPNLTLVMLEGVFQTRAIDENPAPPCPTRPVAPAPMLNGEREGPGKHPVLGGAGFLPSTVV